ncbi:MAG: hypothetical protein ACOC1X_03025 [Promethearchaeota archaeon]
MIKRKYNLFIYEFKNHKKPFNFPHTDKIKKVGKVSDNYSFNYERCVDWSLQRKTYGGESVVKINLHDIDLIICKVYKGAMNYYE